MPPKGSSSQSSTLVARGGGAGSGTTPRQAPSSAGATRRRSSARLANRPGYFYAEESSIFELTPEQVMYLAIGFIVVVFILHIFGKGMEQWAKFRSHQFSHGYALETARTSLSTVRPSRRLISRPRYACTLLVQRRLTLSIPRCHHNIPISSMRHHETDIPQQSSSTPDAQRRSQHQITTSLQSSQHATTHDHISKKYPQETKVSPNSDANKNKQESSPHQHLLSSSHQVYLPPAALSTTTATQPGQHHLRPFLLGALAAFITHYIINFIGTLPAVRRIVRRYFWWTGPTSSTSSLDLPYNSTYIDDKNNSSAVATTSTATYNTMTDTISNVPGPVWLDESSENVSPRDDQQEQQQQQQQQQSMVTDSLSTANTTDDSPSSLSATAQASLLSGILDGESVEWVNMCWRKAWRVYQRGLERWLADLLQPVFDNLVADGTVPRFVLRLRIMEFTLDHEAPSFSNMRRRNSRKDSDLNGVVDVRYTGGARMLLLIECGVGRWRIKVPVMVSELDLECKMWLKIRLAPMVPYIGTLSLAFVGPPTIKVQLAPYNRVRLMRIPILQPLLAKLLTVDLPALMTLPRRLEINIPPAVTAVAEAAVGRDAVMRAVASAVLQADALEHALVSALPLGPQGAAGGISLPDTFQGELQVYLREAKDLPVWGFPWQSNPYCRLALGTQAVQSRRDSETSQTSRHRAPVWNQEFQFLVQDTTVQALEIWVRDSPITGRTEVGYVRLPLSSLPADGMLDAWLPVTSSMPGENVQGAVHLTMAYKTFQDDEGDSGYREAAAYAAMIGSTDREEQEEITDVKSAADASSRAAVAASAAAAAVAVAKAAAARAAARLARGKRVDSGQEEEEDDDDDENKNGIETNIDTSNTRDDTSVPSPWPSNSAQHALHDPSNHYTIEGLALGDRSKIETRTKINTPLRDEALPSTLSTAYTGKAATPPVRQEGDGFAEAALAASALTGTAVTSTDPVAQEAAVRQLESMAETMQRLTEEVQQLNAMKTSSARDAAAAEAAAKAVATAEALAVAAVVAGDVPAANRALQEAAAALEKTAMRVAAESSMSSIDDDDINGQDNVEETSSNRKIKALAGQRDKIYSDQGGGGGAKQQQQHGTVTDTHIESQHRPVTVTPQERAKQALAAAQAAAAAAALAVETASSFRDQDDDNDDDKNSNIKNNDMRSVLSSISGSDDDEATFAPEAIPARNRNSSTRIMSPTQSQDHTDDDDAEETVAPWWNQALSMVPGIPEAQNVAADVAADADGSAPGLPFEEELVDVSRGIVIPNKEDTRDVRGTSNADNGGKESDEKERSDSLPWWSKLMFWQQRGDNVESVLDQRLVKKGHQDASGSDASKYVPSSSQVGEEPVGDIIIGSDIPIEEIAAEVQNSWKLRDRHVETLVQKALESSQRESERPWLIITAVMATSSAVLLAIVLYRITQGL